METFNSVLKAIRPRFLVLTPACVFLGYSTARICCSPIDTIDLFEVLMAGLLAHISVNALNEYMDFRSGLDLATSKTPFSGGSGALPANPSASGWVLTVAVLSLVVTVGLGVQIIIRQGPAVLPLGLIGIGIIVSYTPWLNRLPILCLIAPGIAFGPLMVIGTHVALTGKYAFLPFYISMVPFFLVSNLLLLNQYPDLAADKSVGRNHFPLAFGVRCATHVYGSFVLCAYALVLLGISAGILPRLSAFGLIPMIGGISAFIGVKRYSARTDRLLPHLGANVVAATFTPIVLGFSLINVWQ
ncbi:MAG: prenyltransferase [bacterium]